MARSSGGGSRSGGSRSSSSRSSGGSRSGGSSIRTSSTPFAGSRTFRYYRHGKPIYVYSDRDLRKMKDAKPRWFLIFFYIPFIIAIFTMFGEAIQTPENPMSTYNVAEVQVIDEIDAFTLKEEQALEAKLKEFGEETGVTTKIVTVSFDEWWDNGTLENYSLNRYYADFTDENGWLLVYSSEDNGLGEWSWEGIQGDNTIDVMDVFIDSFNKTLNAQLTVNQIPKPADAFTKAFDKAIDLFNNQSALKVNGEMLIPALGMAAFVTLHASIMIFAGTTKKYSYTELEEVCGDTVKPSKKEEEAKKKIITCQYCNYQYQQGIDNQCPNCGAIIKEGIE